MIFGEIEKLIKTKKKIECFVKARAIEKKKKEKTTSGGTMVGYRQ